MALRGVRVGSKLVLSVTKGTLFASQVATRLDLGKPRRGRQMEMPPVAIVMFLGGRSDSESEYDSGPPGW